MTDLLAQLATWQWVAIYLVIAVLVTFTIVLFDGEQGDEGHIWVGLFWAPVFLFLVVVSVVMAFLAPFWAASKFAKWGHEKTKIDLEERQP